jgi:hypothetical protein
MKFARFCCAGSSELVISNEVGQNRSFAMPRRFANVVHVVKPKQQFHDVAGAGAFAVDPSAQQLRFYTYGKPVGKAAADRDPEQAIVVAAMLAERKKHQRARDYAAADAIQTKLRAMGVHVDDRRGGDGVRQSRDRAFIHPASVAFRERAFPCPYLVYHSKVATSRVFIRDCTAVPPYALLLFGGPLTVEHAKHEIAIDGWVRFDAAPRIGVLVRALRELLGELLERKIADPSLDIETSPVIEALTGLILSDGH